MKRLAVLLILPPLLASVPALAACNIQSASRAASKLYSERVATLPRERADAVAVAMQEAGRLHEQGKNADACKAYETARELLEGGSGSSVMTATPGAPAAR